MKGSHLNVLLSFYCIILWIISQFFQNIFIYTHYKCTIVEISFGGGALNRLGRVQISPYTRPSHVTLGKSLSLCLSFLIFKMGLIIALTFQNC